MITMRSMCLAVVVCGMTVVAARAESNDVVLLKLAAVPGMKVFFGEQEVPEAGLSVAPGATAPLTVTTMRLSGNRDQRYGSFTVLRTAAELEAYELPPSTVSQDLVFASSGATMKVLGGLALQIERATHHARVKLAEQTAGGTNTVERTVVTTNAVMSERTVTVSANATMTASRIERIVWCAENGAVRVFISAPRSAIKPNAPAK